MSRKQKKTLVRILISGALFAGAFFIPVEGIWKLGVYLIPYFVIGWDVLWKAVRNISHGQVFDENFLMSIATIGAFCVGEYPEGVAVIPGRRAVSKLFRGTFPPVHRSADGYPPGLRQSGKSGRKL